MRAMSFGSTVLRVRQALWPDPDRFLRSVTGVIHVGANDGQEREYYARRNLDVLWIEALPDAFGRLRANLAGFPKQRAVQALVTDRDGAEYAFHVASNSGASSSILPFAQHVEMWPDVSFVDKLSLRSVTLDTLLADVRDRYQALVCDTQGSELLVLRGAQRTLERMRYVKTEAPNFNSYERCPQVGDIVAFLEPMGFRLKGSHKFASKKGVGDYFDLLFSR
jgi:FkbM family methyltransferase